MIAATVRLDRDAIRAALGGLSAALSDLRPAWEAVRDIFFTMERAQFYTEGTYTGGGWAPLSPRYAAWKAQHAPLMPGGGTILRLRDRLYTSLTERGHADGIYRPERSAVELGTRVPYAVYHQAGTRKMPRRLVLPQPTRAEGERMVDAILAYCLRTMRERVQAA